MTFKEKLVILRKAKGLTQDEFAAAVGVSRQAVYKWECGQSYPEVPKLLEMKLLFTISIDELLDDNYDIPIPEKKKRKRISKEAAAKIENTVKNEIKIPAAPKAKSAPTPVSIPKAAPAPVTVAASAPNEAPAAAPVYREPAINLKSAAVFAKEEPVAAQPAPAPVSPVQETVVERPINIPRPVIEEENVVEAAKREPAAADAESNKKVGLFGRLFGKK